MRKLKVVFLTVSVMALLVACTQPTVDNGPQSPVATPLSGATPLSELSPLPTLPASPVSPLPIPPLAAEATVEESLSALRTEVAAQLGLAEQALTVISAEQVIWPDASLGCPQPDMAYAQVLTPGWRIVFVDGKGHRHVVHTAEDRAIFVICASPAKPDADSTKQTNPAVAAAIETLVKQEKVAAASVKVVSVAAIEWPNSCLGCETPGRYCLTVITPGYRIVLESGTETYVFHTDRTGRQVILCKQPSLTPAGADS